MNLPDSSESLVIIISDRNKPEEKDMINKRRPYFFSDQVKYWWDSDKAFNFALIDQSTVYDHDRTEIKCAGIKKLAEIIEISGKKEICIFIHETGGIGTETLMEGIEETLEKEHYLIYPAIRFTHESSCLSYNSGGQQGIQYYLENIQNWVKDGDNLREPRNGLFVYLYNLSAGKGLYHMAIEYRHNMLSPFMSFYLRTENQRTKNDPEIRRRDIEDIHKKATRLRKKFHKQFRSYINDKKEMEDRFKAIVVKDSLSVDFEALCRFSDWFDEDVLKGLEGRREGDA